MDTAEPTLVIKTPSDEVPSRTVHYDPSWSVKDLKEHLCANYPTHPAPHTQRLIYAGKLLSDETTLVSLFKNSATGRTIHLVCRNVQNNTNTPQKPSALTTSTNFIDTIPSNELLQYQQEYYDYLRNFYTKQMESCPPPTDISAPTNVSGSAPWSYFYPYHLGPSCPGPYYSGLNSPEGQPQAASPTDNGSAALNPPLADNVAHPDVNGLNRIRGAAAEREAAVNDPAAAAAAPQPQAVLMGNPLAAGFMGDDELGENGANVDIIDRFYMLFRLTLFIGLCFAYSSLDKAIIVFSAAAYIYFYNIYRRHAAARLAAAPARDPAGPQPANPPSNDQTAAPSNSESTITERTRRGPDPQAPLEDDSHPSNSSEQPSTTPRIQPADPGSRLARVLTGVRSVLSISFQFFSALITSLIPEQPPPIRLD